MYDAPDRLQVGGKNIHCANFSSFSIVPAIPLPISAALLANSDLFGGCPFASAFC